MEVTKRFPVDGRYLIAKELGHGSFGTTYLVTELETEKRLALKFLTGGGTDALQRFRREARLLDSQRKNPYVVQLHAHNLDHAPPYIVMEYCEVGSFRPWVTRRQSWRTITAGLAHVLLGLHGLHEAGGFHRDLKPDNLLIAIDPDVAGGFIGKVADFGLAQLPGGNTPMTHGWGGTRAYIAPEINAGQPFDSRADIYSLGVVAVELLTGVRSHAALSAAALPRELRDIVRAMLAESPSDRPTASEIANAFLRLMDADVTAEPEPDDSPVGAFIVAGLLIGGVVAALAALAADDSPPIAKPNVKPPIPRR